LDANPLEDIRNTTKIAAVVFDGKLFSKNAVEGMLAGAEKLAARKSIADAIFKTIQEKNVAAAIQQYHELKTTHRADYEFSEDELVGLGYRLMAMKKFKDAIEVFKLSVEEFPESYNTYDSLGEAYVDNGDKELAIKNYEKSVQLNPKNTNGIEMLKKLKAP
jgi:tetratricopeptide (TPR) repeat protein